MMVMMRAAWLQVKFVPIRALMASTVRSSTMALTWAIRDPTSVRMRVMTTSQRYGLTKGRMFLKSWKRFMRLLDPVAGPLPVRAMEIHQVTDHFVGLIGDLEDQVPVLAPLLQVDQQGVYG